MAKFKVATVGEHTGSHLIFVDDPSSLSYISIWYNKRTLRATKYHRFGIPDDKMLKEHKDKFDEAVAAVIVRAQLEGWYETGSVPAGVMVDLPLRLKVKDRRKAA